MSNGTALLIAVVLLAGNAFFVAAEFSLISARRSLIEPLADAGQRRARITLRAMERVSLMLAGAQLGITVCSLGLGAVGEPAVAHLLEPVFAAFRLPPGMVDPVSFTVALAIVVYLHIVAGEMVPKNIALSGPESAALLLGPVLSGIVTVLKPVIWGLNASANMILRLLRVHTADEVASAFTADEVAALIAESRREGLLQDDEHELLQGALHFTGKAAGELTRPLADLATVSVDVTPRQVQDLTAATGYSRFPIQDPTGLLTGYLHVKDTLLPQGSPDFDRPVPPLYHRPLATIGPHTKITDVVTLLQRQGTHLAQIVDPDTGHVEGVIALEDALREFIGNAGGAPRP